MAEIEAFFAAHPEREYLIREMPMDALDAVMHARWIAGAASCAPADPPRLTVGYGQRSVPCVVRRADPAEGRPLPGVYFMDGGAPLPPLPIPKDADQSRGEEMFAAHLWRLASVSAALGVSLITFTAQALAQELAQSQRKA
jgi:hypothetical protein